MHKLSYRIFKHAIIVVSLAARSRGGPQNLPVKGLGSGPVADVCRGAPSTHTDKGPANTAVGHLRIVAMVGKRPGIHREDIQAWGIAGEPHPLTTVAPRFRWSRRCVPSGYELMLYVDL